MLKKILVLGAALVLVAAIGCSSKSNSTEKAPPARLKIVREAKIGSQWEMKQGEKKGEKEFTLDIKLAEGNKVDGYFYLERGSHVDFQISGSSLIYQSQPPDARTNTITSDR